MSRIRNTGKSCYLSNDSNRIKSGRIQNEMIITARIRRLLEILRPVLLFFKISRKFFSIRVLTFFFFIIHFSRRRTPHNFIFLGMFTLAEGFMLGCVTATYDVNEVGEKSAHQNFSQCYYEKHAFCWCGVWFLSF
jgi:hypothetical protein